MLYAHTLAGHPKEDWQTLHEHLENVGRLAADFASLFGAARTGATLGTHHDAGKATEEFQRRLEGGPRVDHSTAGAVLLGQRWEASPSRQTAALGTMLSRFLAYPILGHHGGMPDAGSEYGTGLDHRLAPGNIQKLPSWDPVAIPLPASPMDVYQEMLPLICKQGRHLDPFRICFALRMLFSCLVDADYLDTERFCTPDIHRLRPAAWKTICIAKDSCTKAVFPRKNLRLVRPHPAAVVLAKMPSLWPDPSSANSANRLRQPLPVCSRSQSRPEGVRRSPRCLSPYSTPSGTICAASSL